MRSPNGSINYDPERFPGTLMRSRLRLRCTTDAAADADDDGDDDRDDVLLQVE
jgi:hypothetical protein